MLNVILESSARALLIAIGTAAILQILRVNAARARHAVWASVVVLMLALPAWTAWGPRAMVRVLNPAATAIINPSATVSVQAQPAGAQPIRTMTWTWQDYLAAVYLLGFGVLLGRLAIGTVRAYMLVRRAANSEGTLSSNSCATPVTVGCLNPAVILPDDWMRWPQAQLDAVLAHEGEHVRRRDPLVQWVALLNRAVFWFHPLSWWLERRLSALAEEACDAAVLARGHDPLAYSEYLLEMARAVQQSGARINVVGMAMPGTSLPERVQRIMEGRPAPRISRLRMAWVAVACAIVSIVFTAGTVGYAQTRTEAQAVANPKSPETPVPASPHKKPKVVLAQAQTSPARPNVTSRDHGSLSGTVEDPSGAVVPQCVITARNQSGAGVEVAVSDPAGSYRFASIPAGRYHLEYASPGFAPLMIDAEIEAGKATRIDATVNLGQEDERVIITGQKPAVPPASTAAAVHTPTRIRVGGNVQPMRLIQKTEPLYPLELQQQGLEGTVLIRAVISLDGTPLNPHVLNHAEVDSRFAQAALESVRQWRFQPPLLNGKPVEMATTITVEFRLGQ